MRFNDFAMYRVAIFTSQPPKQVWQLIRKVTKELPHVQVVGVLHETSRAKPLPQRISSLIRNLRRPAFWPYFLSRIGAAFMSVWRRYVDGLIWIWHGAPTIPLAPSQSSWEQMESALRDLDGALCVTSDIHSADALKFVRGLDADLAVVYGTRILKPELFEIPREGSINLHQRKVPQYRGGGPIGLWELLENEPEIGVTVHRVAAQVDTGNVIRETTIPIHEYDTLQSLGLKADVVSLDLLTQAIADFAGGVVNERPQGAGGKTYKNPSPWKLRQLLQSLSRKRSRYAPKLTRSPAKLFLRLLKFGPVVLVRNWRCRWKKQYPLVILYHHVITDRPHTMGLPTDEFVRHLEYLAKHYQIFSIEEAIKQCETGQLSAPTVVLTFDDGYADNFLNVRAAAQRVHSLATFFVCTANIETRVGFPHDRLAGDVGFEPLTWSELERFADEGYTIASHTRTHFNCGSSDEAALAAEILQSRAELEAGLKRPIRYFSFPWGRKPNMSPEAVSIASGGYDAIFSACNGANLPLAKKPNGHYLRCVHPTSVLELELTLQSILEIRPESETLSF